MGATGTLYHRTPSCLPFAAVHDVRHGREMTCDHNRRRFLSAAAVAVAAAPLRAVAARRPQSTSANTFGALKQIDAGVLNVGYAELGPAQGGAVVLLHGWPYDIHSYVDVAPLLASAGYRVIVPYLRGYGTTRFRSADAIRNAQQSVLAADTVARRRRGFADL